MQGLRLDKLTICTCMWGCFAQFFDEVVHSDLEIGPVVYIPDGWVLMQESGRSFGETNTRANMLTLITILS